MGFLFTKNNCGKTGSAHNPVRKMRRDEVALLANYVFNNIKNLKGRQDG